MNSIATKHGQDGAYQSMGLACPPLLVDATLSCPWTLVHSFGESPGTPCKTKTSDGHCFAWDPPQLVGSVARGKEAVGDLLP